MATVTFNQYLDAVRWHMYEKGLQVIWNDLKKFSRGTLGTNFGSSQEIQDNVVSLHTDDSATVGNSKPFVPCMPDPGGGYGLVPPRASNTRPTAGFITSP